MPLQSCMMGTTSSWFRGLAASTHLRPEASLRAIRGEGEVAVGEPAVVLGVVDRGPVGPLLGQDDLVGQGLELVSEYTVAAALLTE